MNRKMITTITIQTIIQGNMRFFTLLISSYLFCSSGDTVILIIGGGNPLSTAEFVT